MILNKTEQLLKSYKDEVEKYFHKNDEIKNQDINNFDKEFENVLNVLHELEGKIENFDNKHFSYLIDNFNNIINQGIMNVESDFEKFTKLLINNLNILDTVMMLISNKDHSVVIGANGAGKTTLVNSLSKSGLENLFVIPAQKMLYFSDNAYNRTIYTHEKFVSEYQKPFNDDVKRNNSMENDSINNLFYPFTKLITTLVNDEIMVDVRNKEMKKNSKSLWDDVNMIWRKVIPDINFKIDGINRKPEPQKEQNIYDINGLSDGEKVILYFIGNVLMAKRDSTIIIDEPETYLNPSVYNKLWDLLIDFRNDCKFIFSTHNVTFVNGRKNCNLIWCKRFKSSLDKDIEDISDSDLPENLITELLGSTKKILFCEGKRNSYDYQLLSNLYAEQYMIIPVDGHDNVINYTKNLNKNSKLIGKETIGLIDRDGISENDEAYYKKSKIYCLPYNEIEMLFLDEVVMSKTLELLGFKKDDIDFKIDKFKKALIKEVDNSKDEIIQNIVKNIVDRMIQKSFLDKEKNVDVVTAFEKFTNEINVEAIKKQEELKIEENIKNENYPDILEICTLKDEALKGMANTKLYHDYSDSVLRYIRDKDELKDAFRNLLKLPIN
ncbi:hypothetical protein AKUH3B101J_11460 [Apilactobacillus kunkeei]|uniref:AAA family ATPase n=1 Tax=Apilactobacillus kunkeei TaxID=148814 RepID=UPI00200A1E16|nr:AAA family ATPase [Apilactobacillus kunkeei]MCK8625329.1 AAA family ATPase [Apilactobacillus kunkeei]CAI2633495.1 hypothetical protein AKUH3B104J_11460 [Apilactobacillus kunkeei]CAI2638692.1 hypothetical protein AKUH3B101J_11460 [Apilactobacillus kunkeei]